MVDLYYGLEKARREPTPFERIRDAHRPRFEIDGVRPIQYCAPIGFWIRCENCHGPHVRSGRACTVCGVVCREP